MESYMEHEKEKFVSIQREEKYNPQCNPIWLLDTEEHVDFFDPLDKRKTLPLVPVFLLVQLTNSRASDRGASNLASPDTVATSDIG